jgi:hypothetical protein
MPNSRIIFLQKVSKLETAQDSSKPHLDMSVMRFGWLFRDFKNLEKISETKSLHRKLAGKLLLALNLNRYIKKRHKSFLKNVSQNNFLILQLPPS